MRCWYIRALVALIAWGAADATVDEGEGYSEIREWSELWNYISGRRWEDALKRLSDHPEEASTLIVRKKGGRRFGPIEVKNLPLHQLFAVDVMDAGSAASLKTMQTMQAAQTHVAEVLLRLHPSAAFVPDHNDRLPLHLAAYSSVPPTRALLDALITAHPKAAAVADSDGRLPLHAATYQPLSSFTAVQRVLSVNPEALYSEAKDGSLPIHLASWAGGLHHGGEDEEDDATQIIRLLHSFSPDAQKTLRRVDGDDDSVLQIMVKYARTSEGSLRYVLQVDPSAVTELKDSRGNTPLHSALSIVRLNQSATSTLPVETVVSLLLDASPTAVENANNLEQLPLHIALHQCCVDVAVTRLLNSVKGIASKKDATGNLPLHYACREGVEDPAVVRDLLESFPDGAVTSSPDGQFPLHLALAAPVRRFKGSPSLSPSEGPMDIVALALLQSYPGAARTMDQKTKRWPLHLAIAKKSPYSLVDALIKENVAAVRETIEHDGNAITVFHQIALVTDDYELTALRSVTRLLVDTWSSGTREKDSNGRLPHHTLVLEKSLRGQKQGTYGRFGSDNERAEVTHMTIRSRRSAFLEMMLSIHPDGASTRDKDGEIPLHHACRVGDLPSVLQLMKIYPDGAGVRRKALDGDENEGRLPLHIVMHELSSNRAIAPLGPPGHGKPSILDSIVMTLLEARPEAAGMPDREDKGRLPLHQLSASMTGRQYLSTDALSRLHNAYPDAVKTKDDMGNLPLSLVLADVRSSSMPLVRKMIDMYPGAVSERVNGNLPIHLALSYATGSVAPSDDYMALFKIILDKHTDAAKEVDGNGRLPIHQLARLVGESAVDTNATASWGDLMIRVMDLNSGGIRKLDKVGRTPLHIFCLHYGDAVIVESDRTQSTLPRNHHVDDLIRRMLAAYPGAMKVVDTKGKKPIDMLGDHRITTITGRDVGPRSVSFSHFRRMVVRGPTFWGLVQQVDQITTYLAQEQTKEPSRRKCRLLADKIDRFTVALRAALASQEKESGSAAKSEIDSSDGVEPIVRIRECDRLDEEGLCRICAEERKGVLRLWHDLNRLGSFMDASSFGSPSGDGSSSNEKPNAKSKAKRANSSARNGLDDEL